MGLVSDFIVTVKDFLDILLMKTSMDKLVSRKFELMQALVPFAIVTLITGVWQLIFRIIFGILGAVLGVVLAGAFSGGNLLIIGNVIIQTIFGLAFDLIISPFAIIGGIIFGVVFLGIFAFIHSLLAGFFGAQKDFMQYLPNMMYLTAGQTLVTGLLSPIPLLNLLAVPLGFYFLFLDIMLVKAFFKLDDLKAAGVVLIPLAILFAIALAVLLVVFLIFGVAILASPGLAGR